MKKIESTNLFTRKKEWIDNLKKKLNADMPKVDKYRGKIIHKKSTFTFSVGEDDYLIICPARKTGNNIFNVYKDGVKIYTHTPQGNHVNKTMAEFALRLAINRNLSNLQKP